MVKTKTKRKNIVKNLLDNAILIVHNTSKEPCPALPASERLNIYFLETVRFFLPKV